MAESKLTAYFTRFPESTLDDLFKFLHQSAFGCGHIVSDEESAIARIREEVPSAAQDRVRGVEMLDGPFVRVHLSAVAEGLSPETLGKLLVLSSKKEAGGLSVLTASLDELLRLCRAGELPFSEADASAAITRWRESGYAPCRHSGRFHRAYHPAYRVIAAEYARFLPLLREIDTRMAKGGALLAAIDGRCASGKSTLGALLAKLYDCNVFHMDDYFLQPSQRTAERLQTAGENVDHERFLAEVLLPASKGENIVFRRYDCRSGTLEMPVTVLPKRLTVVEGVYCLHETLAPRYDLTVFSDVAPALQRERIEARGGAMAERFFREWIPLEEKYFAECRVRERADIILP